MSTTTQHRGTGQHGGASRRSLAVVLGVLLAAVIAAGVISFYASSAPDGLTSVAEDKEFAHLEEGSPIDDSPLAGYGTSGVESERLSVGIAGVVGVAITFVVAGGLFLVVRRRSTT